MKKKTYKKLFIATILGVALLSFSVVKADVGDLYSQIAEKTGYYLAQILGNKVEETQPAVGFTLGAAGDTYQTAKIYSKVTASGTTLPASISCNNWLIKSARFYLTASSTANTTGTMSLGIANSSTTTLATTLTTATFSTSSANYLATSTVSGTGTLCTSTQYIVGTMSTAATTTNGVLSVEYLNYQ